MLERGLDTDAGEQLAKVGELQLCFQTFGERGAPPMLLVMGLGSQMVMWEDEFCETLAARGFHVIRFDNRDVGRSTILRDAPIPTRVQLLMRDRRGASYTLGDMAADAAGLLAELGLEAAHVVGASMGGMIAQQLAIDHPDRVSSLVSIMSTTGNRRVGQPHPLMLPRLLRRPSRGRDRYIADFVATFQAIGSRTHPPDASRLRGLAERCWDRGYHPAGTARQLAAIGTAEDRSMRLAELRIPATVIHGTEDRLVMPSGGRATAKAIPDARLMILRDMGHDMPRELWPQLIDAIVANAATRDGRT
jgi:pimeloyl-ACP methyl ester carboxylesterase